MGADNQFAEIFQQLTAVFEAGLAARVAEIDAAWELSNSRAGETDGLRHMHRLLHSLSGTSGTFGYKLLGEKAKALELHVAAVMASGSGISGGDAVAVACALQELRLASRQPG